MENKRAHLEMIQGVINRLSHNSFLLKGWSVILVSALLALAPKGSQVLFVYLAYFPAITFWGLDGYFLRQEKVFRELYNSVRGMDKEEIDFSMDTSNLLNRVDPWWCTTLSKTLIPFHGVILIAIILVTYFSNNT